MQVPCFCAFCKTERKIYSNRHVGMKEFLSSCGLALATNFTFFGEFDARALPLIILYCIFFELALQVRWRMNVICPHCGFDPVLYVRDRDKAVERVKDRLEERRSNPIYLLSKTPLLNLPIRRVRANDHSPISIVNEMPASVVSLSKEASRAPSLDLRKPPGARTVTK